VKPLGCTPTASDEFHYERKSSMSNIVPFNFENKNVRVVEIDGDPWFVAKDVCDALGYANSRKAVLDHCKAAERDGVTFRDAMGRDQNYTIIPERDVYRLIMRSNLPSAERFEELVVGEILPAIRKTGSYGVQSVSMDAARMREARLWSKHVAQMGKLIGLEGNQLALSVNQAVKATCGVDVLGDMGVTHIEAPQNEMLLTPTQIAHRAGLRSAQAVNKMLAADEYQVACQDHKGKTYYEPTAKGRSIGATMMDTGKRHSTGTPVRQLKWPSSVCGLLGDGGVQ
jgi:prophage antirepressor-like protein/predicted transcriptional regulator